MPRNFPLPRLEDYYGVKASNIFPVGRLRFEGKLFQVVGIDAAIYLFLRDLARELRGTDFHPGRLCRLRADFREICRHRSPIGVLYSISSNDLLQRRLAVWLIGRMKWYRGVLSLRNCPASAPLELQLEVARAMKRMRAWTELRQFELRVIRPSVTVAGLFGEQPQQSEQLRARLHRMCQQHAARDYAERLSNFLSADVSSSSSTNLSSHERPPLWYQEPLGPGQEPKSPWFIRRILERIRVAVRG